MEPIKTITIFSTKNSTYAIAKTNYKHTKNHIHVWEIDLPDEFGFTDTKKKLSKYIDDVDELQKFIANEVQKLVDTFKK